MDWWPVTKEERLAVNDPDEALSWKERLAYYDAVRPNMDVRSGVAYVSDMTLARSCEVRPRSGRHNKEEIRATRSMGRVIRANLIKSGICSLGPTHPKYGPGLKCNFAMLDTSVSRRSSHGAAMEQPPQERTPDSKQNQKLNDQEPPTSSHPEPAEEPPHSDSSDSSCTTPPQTPHAEPGVFASLPTKEGESFDIAEELVPMLEADFPTLDVRRSLRECVQKAIAHYGERRPYMSSLQRIRNWLQADLDQRRNLKDQPRGKTHGNRPSADRRSKTHENGEQFIRDFYGDDAGGDDPGDGSA